jgi:hypothetical protein
MPPQKRRKKHRTPLQKARRLYHLFSPKEFMSQRERKRVRRIQSTPAVLSTLHRLRLVDFVERTSKRQRLLVRRRRRVYTVRVRPSARAAIVINSMLRRGDFNRLRKRQKDLIGRAILVRELSLLDQDARRRQAKRRKIPMSKTQDPKIAVGEIRRSLAREYHSLADHEEIIAQPIRIKDAEGRTIHGPRADDFSPESVRQIAFFKNESKATEYALVMLRDRKVQSEIRRIIAEETPR